MNLNFKLLVFSINFEWKACNFKYFSNFDLNILEFGQISNEKSVSKSNEKLVIFKIFKWFSLRFLNYFNFMNSTLEINVYSFAND